MNRLRRLLTIFSTALVLLASMPTSLFAHATAGAQSNIPLTRSASAAPIQHIFIIVMENKGYPQVWNTASTPYITALGNAYARATNYHAITHPSLPNYLDLIAGSSYGIGRNCDPSSSCHINAPNLADSMEANGISWRAYMQSMPSACYQRSSGSYVPRHNPFLYFDDIRKDAARCQSHVVPLKLLSTNLLSAFTTPNYVFITPNTCKDMHDCSISTGDLWLRKFTPKILRSPACTVETCLVVITWDEDGDHDKNRVLTIFAGSAARTGGFASSATYNHFSLLRTVEANFGLPALTSNDAAASLMTDMLR